MKREYPMGEFGIKDTAMLTMHDRVMKEALVADVFGRPHVLFADISPVDLAAVHADIEPHGVLLVASAFSQYDAVQAGHRIENQSSRSAEMVEPTDDQRELLEKLAGLDSDDTKPMRKKDVAATRNHLPALWYSDIAVSMSGLRFVRGGFLESYTGALERITDAGHEMREPRDGFHELLLGAQLLELTTAATREQFVILAAKAAHAAFTTEATT